MFSNVQWIQNDSNREEKYNADEALIIQHELLVEGGFERVAKNVIEVMKDVTGENSWNPLRRYRKQETKNVSSDVSRSGLSEEDQAAAKEAKRKVDGEKNAKNLIKFCEFLLTPDSDNFINAIAVLNPADQMKAFKLLYTYTCSDKAENRLQDFNSFCQCTVKSRWDTYIETCRTYGILTVLQSLFNPNDPISSSTCNGGLALLLSRELCPKRAMDDRLTYCKNTHRYDESSNTSVPYTDAYVIAEMTKGSLDKLSTELFAIPTKLQSIKFAQILGDEKDSELSAINIDLDKKVSVDIGVSGYIGNKTWGLFGSKTSISLRDYLKNLVVSDPKSKEKFDLVLRALGVRSLHHAKPGTVRVEREKLMNALSQFRRYDKQKREDVLVKKIDMLHLNTGFFYPNKTTGEKIFDALLLECKNESKATLKTDHTADSLSRQRLSS